MQYDDVTTSPIWRTGRSPYWESFSSCISMTYCPINAKFGVKKQNYAQTQVTWTKYQISKIQHVRRLPYWKSFYRYISAGNRLISIKFGVQMQILVPKTVSWQRIKMLQIQNGRQPSYQKLFLAISQQFIVQLMQNLIWRSKITLDMNIKFGMKKQNHTQTYVAWPKWRPTLLK